MFIRTVKVKDKEYLRLVENRRERDGKVKQIVLSNLGNKEKVRANLSKIISGLEKNLGVFIGIKDDRIKLLKALEAGRIMLIDKLWREVGLDEYIKEKIVEKGEAKEVKEEYIKLMVANRLCEPKSKLGILDWIEDIDLEGVNELRTESKRLKRSVVNKLYRAMDFLVQIKKKMEVYLYHRVKDLFNLKVDVLFYDITSSYFEGDKSEYGERGYARDGKSGNKQIVLGIVKVKEFPLASYVMRGNKLDKKSVRGVLYDIKKRFEIKRCILVGDRGMISEEVIKELKKDKIEYILATKRRDRRIIELFKGNESEVKIEKVFEGSLRLENDIDVFYKESLYEGDRIIMYYNPARAEKDRDIREKKLEKLKSRLDNVKKLFQIGRYKKEKVLIQKVEKVLSRNFLRKLIKYDVKEDGFNWWIDKDGLEMEGFIDGVFFIRTNDKKLSTDEIIRRYKELIEIEFYFRDLKDFIHLRPIYHYKARRISAHVFICVLSLFLEKLLEARLRRANLKMTGREALYRVRTIRKGEIEVNGEKLQRLTQINNYQNKILQL